jgi:hypothetical protein
MTGWTDNVVLTRTASEAPAKSQNDHWNYREISPALLARQSRRARQWTIDVLV